MSACNNRIGRYAITEYRTAVKRQLSLDWDPESPWFAGSFSTPLVTDPVQLFAREQTLGFLEQQPFFLVYVLAEELAKLSNHSPVATRSQRLDQRHQPAMFRHQFGNEIAQARLTERWEQNLLFEHKVATDFSIELRNDLQRRRPSTGRGFVGRQSAIHKYA
jgi:hypothetical protein